MYCSKVARDESGLAAAIWWPHSGQNRAWSGNDEEHSGHVAFKAVPQEAQNLAPSGHELWQLGHSMSILQTSSNSRCDQKAKKKPVGFALDYSRFQQNSSTGLPRFKKFESQI
jgi:hypothetical protein